MPRNRSHAGTIPGGTNPLREPPGPVIDEIVAGQPVHVASGVQHEFGQHLQTGPLAALDHPVLAGLLGDSRDEFGVNAF
jgi:hypothetical protein